MYELPYCLPCGNITIIKCNIPKWQEIIKGFFKNENKGKVCVYETEHTCFKITFIWAQIILDCIILCCCLCVSSLSGQRFTQDFTCGEDDVLRDELMIHDGELGQFDLVHSRHGVVSAPPVKLDVICGVTIWNTGAQELLRIVNAQHTRRIYL